MLGAPPALAGNGVVSGIIGFWPDDGVVEIEAGVSMGELKAALREGGQGIAYGEVHGVAGEGSAVGDLVLAGVPHPLEGRHGGWKEWLLGARMRLRDGSAGASGSRVVKSVAGFDVHRMMVGSGGTLGAYETLILRTSPLALLPEWEVPPQRAGAVQRVLPSLLAPSPGVFVVDEAGACLWWEEGVDVVRSEEDRVWVPGATPEPESGTGTEDERWFFERARGAFGAV